MTTDELLECIQKLFAMAILMITQITAAFCIYLSQILCEQRISKTFFKYLSGFIFLFLFQTSSSNSYTTVCLFLFKKIKDLKRKIRKLCTRGVCLKGKNRCIFMGWFYTSNSTAHFLYSSLVNTATRISCYTAIVQHLIFQYGRANVNWCRTMDDGCCCSCCLVFILVM